MTEKQSLYYILCDTMKTKSCDCSTYAGSCIANEGACCKCTRTFVDLHCTTPLFKDERETKESDRRIVDIKVYVNSMR